MHRTYNKLVRDQIPEIIRKDGYSCETECMDDESYQQALRTKLVEEATEVATANADCLAAEIADLYEVIDALLTSNQLSETRVRELQVQRRQERGGFTQRIRLLNIHGDEAEA